MIPREDVAAAVFALLAPLTLGSPPLVKTVSRRIQPAAQMQPGAMPAVFQVQMDETVESISRTLEGMYVTVMNFEWFVYAHSSDPNASPSSVLNPIVDAVLGCLPAALQVPFVVDNVPMPLFWDGSIAYVEGIIMDMSIARIPVKVKVPWGVPAP
jgi:hypothetical protein